MAENGGQISSEELALIKGYYEKVIQLVRYNKNKDDAIDRISKENEHYRTGFNQWVYKPLAMSLIDMRENCKRELAGMAGREYTAERLRRNFGLLAEELDGIIIDNGGDITEDDVLFEGRSVLKPYQPLVTEIKEEAPAEEAAEQPADEAAEAAEEVVSEAPAADEVTAEVTAEETAEEPAEEGAEEAPAETEEETAEPEEEPAPTLAEVLEGYQKQITDLLAENTVLENTLKEALAHNAEVDAENKFRLVYPVIKGLYMYSDSYHHDYGWLYEGGAPADSEPDKVELYGDPAALKSKYMEVLGCVIEKLLAVLEDLGVSTLNNIEDKFDPTCQQMAKNIPTDVEENDRKIANYVTDGYILDGKLIYRQKVDLYKFKKQ